MVYRIEFSRRAQRKFESLPKARQAALEPVISALANDPRPSGAKKVKELDRCYRLRHGDFRIVYAVSYLSKTGFSWTASDGAQGANTS